MKPDPETLGLGGNPMSPECMRTLKRAWVGSNGMGNRRRIEIGWSPEDDPRRAAFIAAKLQELHRSPKVAR